MTGWIARIIAVVLASVVLAASPAAALLGDIRLGAGVFEVSIPTAKGPASMRVFTFRPKSYDPSRPIVIVLHGTNRDADYYRDSWIKPGALNNLLVLAPEFTEKQFHGSRGYNLANIFQKSGRQNPRDQWVFSIIDRVFDAARRMTGSACRSYGVFGHSAGGQLVHRMVTMAPETRIDLAIAANSGWYTLPSLSTKWPYGLKGTPVTQETLDAAFSRNLIVLLGDRDTNPNSKYLRRTPEAKAQGPHRLARGQNYMHVAGVEAARRGLSVAWRQIVVKGVGHSGSSMAKRAARLFAMRPACGVSSPAKPQ